MITVKRISVLALITLFALAAVPALAQSSTATHTITEQQANQAYRVTNPINRTLSNIVIDFQPDQVVIDAIMTLRGQDPLDVSGTLVPEVRNGRIYWTVSTVLANGEQVSDSLLTQINNALASSWRSYFREQAVAGRVTDVTITDDSLVITYTRRR